MCCDEVELIHHKNDGNYSKQSEYQIFLLSSRIRRICQTIAINFELDEFNLSSFGTIVVYKRQLIFSIRMCTLACS